MKLSEVDGVIKHVVRLAKKAAKFYFAKTQLKEKLEKQDYKREKSIM